MYIIHLQLQYNLFPAHMLKKITFLKNSLKKGGGGDNINQLVKRSVTCNSWQRSLRHDVFGLCC